MPWPFSESIKKRACRYLLQRYLGHFLQEKLSLEQLSLDLYQGTGSLAQVPLDKWGLNEILESADAPLEVTEGFIQSISLSVPWGSLLQDNCALEVRGLEMVFRPRPRVATGSEPMYWSSFMTSSMQLAKECLSQKLTDEQGEASQPFEGLEKFAETIETVLRRVKVTFIDTVLRIEHVPENSKTGAALEIRVERTVYCDETADESSGVNVHQPTDFAHKLLQLSGVSLFWDEFSASAKSSPVCSTAPVSPEDLETDSMTLDLLTCSFSGFSLLQQQLLVFTPFQNSSKIGLANKDRKNRPMQQEDEYRIQMELNRYYLRKDSLSMGVSSEKSFYETETARTPSSRALPSRSVSVDESRPEFICRLDIGVFSVSVLHIDPLSPAETSPNVNPLTPMAVTFFSCIEKMDPTRLSTEDFKFFRAVFAEACSHDHLRFIGTGIKVSYEQRQRSTSRHFSTNMSIGQMEFLECLFPTDFHSVPPHYTEHKAFTEVFLDDAHSPANRRVSVQVTTPALHLSVRFPIPDLRSDQERGPWFKKSLQKETLHLAFTDLESKTEFVGGSTPEQTKLELTFRELTGSFQEEKGGPSVKFFHVSGGVDGDTASSDDFDWPRVMFENEQMVMPGDPVEMTEFQDKAISNSHYVLELLLPNVHMTLPSKSFYEKLYNRIFNDLLLWEPTAPSPVETLENISYGIGLSVASQLINTFSKDSFSPFKSAVHYGIVDGAILHTEARLPNSTRPHWLEPTIYSSEEDGLSRAASDGVGGDNLNMLSVAVKILSDKSESNTKILNFLNIADEPVLGYNPPTSFTTFHVHLWSCALDYRPLHLPIRSLLTVETFSISSSVALDKSSSTLRIIMDEAALHLSDKCNTVTINLNRDYVRVMDMGLLELTITAMKSDSEGEQTEPRFELHCSSDVVHIRTCSDSCAALMNLIQYVASYGDLHAPNKAEMKPGVPQRKPKVDSSGRPSSRGPVLPEADQQILRDLMSDAMEEIDMQQASTPVGSQTNGVLDERSHPQEPCCSDLFLFPDESGSVSQEPGPACASLPHHLISDTMTGVPAENDDFCILFAPKAAIQEKEEEPVVKIMVDEAIVIRDDYFSLPITRTDSSKAPLHLPVPAVRYVVKEVSLVWHLYGGKDFATVPPASPAKSYISPHSSPSQTPTRHGRHTVYGGKGRNHDFLMEIQLSKVKFQHEVYPPCKPECESSLLEYPVSRQVFIVQDLEIRDRLATSQMNKFLYLYCSKDMPRKAHSNMLTIKALHVRPESGRLPQECCLRVSLMPLRLNIDQDALFFLKDFFTSLSTEVELLLTPDPEVQGLKDLVWLPIEQYRKDGRIVRGFQRGAASFGTSTAMAALELTNRMVQTIQAAAETAYDMVSPGTLSIEPKKAKRFPHHRLAHQPVDLREGVAKAYSVVKEGIADTAQTIYETAAREHESRGVTGAVGEVLRQIPPAVVKPLIVATEATSNVLGGMRNQIRPDVRQDESQKWRHGED
ncbi:hypothetical protein NN561_014843 [Cricetulus griseus]